MAFPPSLVYSHFPPGSGPLQFCSYSPAMLGPSGSSKSGPHSLLTDRRPLNSLGRLVLSADHFSTRNPHGEFSISNNVYLVTHLIIHIGFHSFIHSMEKNKSCFKKQKQISFWKANELCLEKKQYIGPFWLKENSPDVGLTLAASTTMLCTMKKGKFWASTWHFPVEERNSIYRVVAGVEKYHRVLSELCAKGASDQEWLRHF